VPTILPPDPDALAYIAAVETADGQALEDGVKSAYDQFFKGLKQDGIWTALQASCILAGARTLSGALIPLVGTAPTNNNFVSGDYNRKTGLLGNGSTKRLNSINNAQLGQNNNHIYIRVTDEDRRTVSAGLMGTLHAQTGSTSMRRSGNAPLTFNCMSSSASIISGTNLFYRAGCGVSRNSGTTFSRMENSALLQGISAASQTPRSEIISVLALTGSVLTTSRAAFFSAGGFVNLAALDTRVSSLMTALAAAIP
jgi:hypothetical protein